MEGILSIDYKLWKNSLWFVLAPWGASCVFGNSAFFKNKTVSYLKNKKPKLLPRLRGRPVLADTGQFRLLINSRNPAKLYFYGNIGTRANSGYLKSRYYSGAGCRSKFGRHIISGQRGKCQGRASAYIILHENFHAESQRNYDFKYSGKVVFWSDGAS